MKELLRRLPRRWVGLAVVVISLIPAGLALAETPVQMATFNSSPLTPPPSPPPPTATPTSTPLPVPSPSPPPPSPPPPSPPSPAPYPPAGILGQHTVRLGETLYCIGRAYGVDPYAIAARNAIVNPNLIYPGLVLDIPNMPRSLPAGRVCPRQFDGAPPPPPPCRWQHTVVWGENLYRISLRYGVSMWTIARANAITNLHLIIAGQRLCIP